MSPETPKPTPEATELPELKVEATETEAVDNVEAGEKSIIDTISQISELGKDEAKEIDAALSKMTDKQLKELAEKGNPDNPAVKRAKEIVDAMES